jgi:hypothetical protein
VSHTVAAGCCGPQGGLTLFCFAIARSHCKQEDEAEPHISTVLFPTNSSSVLLYAMSEPVIATPIYADDKQLDPKAATEKQNDQSQSQKLFAVSEGRSFEDQAGFFGRW